MDEVLNLDNILDNEQIDDLLLDDDILSGEEDPEIREENNNKKHNTTEDANPESVGGEDTSQEKEKDTIPPKSDGASPQTFYSSIAKALKEEGVFSDLEDDTINKIKNPEDFKSAIETKINSMLDEKQKRIDDALNAGVESSDIKKYENTLSYFDSINENDISEESEKGESLRKQLIYQDCLNRGYSKERAQKEVKKSIDAGTDIDDAKDALQDNVEFFQQQYNSLIEEAKAEEETYKAQMKQMAEQLQKSIMEDEKLFGSTNISASTRKKVFENISKPVYKDPKTGESYTAIQQYEKEHRTDFLKNLSLIFTLTDGFKNFDNLGITQAKKEIKKGLRNLEDTLNNTARDTDGNLNFVSGTDSESIIGKEWDLDV